MDLLQDFYNSCDPLQPATEAQYVETDASRGSESLVREFRRILKLAANKYRRLLFTGHIGCGKSSELKKLQRLLEHPEPGPGYHRYFVIYFDVRDYLDDYDTEIADILLAIVAELGDSFRERLGIELQDGYFTRRLGELKDFLASPVEINEAAVELFNVKPKIQRLKTDPTNRTKVREKLQPQLGTLLGEMDILFETAREKLKNLAVPDGGAPYHDFVFVLDDLEKIRRFAGKAEGLESQRELFVEHYAQLTGFNTHIIYTVPLALARSPDATSLRDHYSQPLVLPMIKTCQRAHPGERYEMGWKLLEELLARRAPQESLGAVMDADAVEFLIQYCGGSVRALLAFVQTACSETDAAPIERKHAVRAVQREMSAFSTSIPDGHWIKLAELSRNPDCFISNDDPASMIMLTMRTVLEYLNGGDDTTLSEEAEPWYRVNPVVCDSRNSERPRRGWRAARPRRRGSRELAFRHVFHRRFHACAAGGIVFHRCGRSGRGSRLGPRAKSQQRFHPALRLLQRCGPSGGSKR